MCKWFFYIIYYNYYFVNINLQNNKENFFPLDVVGIINKSPKKTLHIVLLKIRFQNMHNNE